MVRPADDLYSYRRTYGGNRGYSGGSASTASGPGRGRGGKGQFKMTLAQQARTMSYYNPVPKQQNFFTANRSLFLLGIDNPVRKLAKQIVEWPPFEYLILITIVANCIVLALEEHLPEGDKTPRTNHLELTEPYFLGIFVVEAAVKILALGFVCHEGSYLRYGWNVMDFIVVVTGCFTYFEPSSSGSGVQTLRAVRVLRPLKLVSGIPSLQVVLKSIMKAMVPLLQIAILLFFFIIVCSIVGLELYMGKFHKTCYVESKPNQVLRENQICRGNTLLENQPSYLCPANSTCRKWPLGPNYGITTFDSIVFSMLTVFQCITMEGWTNILYFADDAVGGDFNWAYFLTLIVVGSFFMLNLVLGVLSGEFAKERERVESRLTFLKVRKKQQIDRELDGYLEWMQKAEEVMLDEEEQDDETNREGNNQQRSRDNKTVMPPVAEVCFNNLNGLNSFQRNSMRGTPSNAFLIWLQRREKRFRINCRHMVKSTLFYWLVLFLVLLNTIFLFSLHYGQPIWWEKFLYHAEFVFLGLFSGEILIKIYGLGPAAYFRSTFNIFDFVVIVGSVFEIIWSWVTPDVSFGISVLRALRLLRVFKFTSAWSGLRNLVVSLMSSLRSIVSLIFLLFLFLVVFALLGMQIFGGKFSFDDGRPNSNFDSFPSAMLTVFQILTGEDWNAVMYDGVRARGGINGKGLWWTLYFIFLVLFGNYTLLNVFLAIAVDNLANAQELTKDEEEEKDCQEVKKALRVARELEGVSPGSVDNLRMKIAETATRKRSPGVWERRQEEMRNQRQKLLGESSILTEDSDDEFYVPGAPRSGKYFDISSAPTAVENNVLEAGRLSPLKQSDFRETKLLLGLSPIIASGKHSIIKGVMSELIWKAVGKTVPDLTGSTSEPRTSRSRDKRDSSTNDRSSKDSSLYQIAGSLSDWDSPKKQADDVERNGNDLKVDDVGELRVGIGEDGPLQLPSSGSLSSNGSSENGPKSMLPYSSMFVFSPTNPIRCACHFFVNLRHFESTILVIIILSSITLAAEDPVLEESRWNQILKYFDYIFSAVFTFEMIMKMIDLGLFLHPGSYFHSFWNILDFVVVCSALVGFGFTATKNSQLDIGVIKSLRVLRVLRPLKTIKRLPKLKAVFMCVVNAFRNVATILVIFMLFMLIFSVIAVELFKGKFYFCTDPMKHTIADCKGNYIKDLPDGTKQIKERVWEHRKFHFDNIHNSFLTLFVISTGEGWPDVLWNSVGSTHENEGPQPGYRIEVSLFYIVFFIVFPFFFINIFVAFIIITFQEEGDKAMSNCSLDKNERACIEFVISSKPLTRFMPADRQSFQYKMWKVVTSSQFEWAVMGLIVLNTIVLMLKYNQMSVEYDTGLHILNIIFTTLFTLECLVKTFAYGLLNYFKDSWNVFDFVTVVGSIVDIFMQRLEDGFSINLSILRLFRAARLIKLLRQGETIRILLWTFVQSIKALPYVCLLIAMLFFIYAIIGMQLFGNIKLDPENEINDHNNFRNIAKAIMLLFRSATGESWQSIMLDCVDAECDSSSSNSRCGSPLSYIYFTSFIFFCSFLMLNLFVAVIMDNFDYLTRDISILGPHHLDEFVRKWADHDPQGTGYLKFNEMFQLLKEMEPPLGFGQNCPNRVAYRRLLQMNMPINKDKNVHFTTTLFALIRTSLKIKPLPKYQIKPDKTFKNEKLVNQELRDEIVLAWPRLSKKKLMLLIPLEDENPMTVGKVYSTCMMINLWKAQKSRRAASSLAATDQGQFTSNVLSSHNFDVESEAVLPDTATEISLYTSPSVTNVNQPDSTRMEIDGSENQLHAYLDQSDSHQLHGHNASNRSNGVQFVNEKPHRTVRLQMGGGGGIEMADMKPRRASSLKHQYMQSPFISITASTPGSDDDLPSPREIFPPTYSSHSGNGSHPRFPQILPAAILRRHSSTETPDRSKELKKRTNSLPRLHHTSMDESEYDNDSVNLSKRTQLAHGESPNRHGNNRGVYLEDQNIGNPANISRLPYEEHKRTSREVFPSFVYCDEQQLYEQMSPDNPSQWLLVGPPKTSTCVESADAIQPCHRNARDNFGPIFESTPHQYRKPSTYYYSPQLHRRSSNRAARRRYLPQTPTMRRNCASQVNLPSYVQRANGSSEFFTTVPPNNRVAYYANTPQRLYTGTGMKKNRTLPKNLHNYYDHRSNPSTFTELHFANNPEHYCQSCTNLEFKRNAYQCIANDQGIPQQEARFSPISQRSSNRSYCTNPSSEPPLVVNRRRIENFSPQQSEDSHTTDFSTDSSEKKAPDKIHSTFVRMRNERPSLLEPEERKQPKGSKIIGKLPTEHRRSLSIEELRAGNKHLNIANAKRSPSSSMITELHM